MDMNCEIYVELFVENNEQYVFISHAGSSGCKYRIDKLSDVGKYVNQYVKNYVA